MRNDAGAPGELDRATRMRLYWIAGLVGAGVFLVGIVVFGLLWRLGAGPPEGPRIQQAEFAADASTGLESVGMRAGGEFVHAVQDEATTFSPLYATGESGPTVVDLLFPRLLGQDPVTGLATPTGLAERWEISLDQRTYTFYLRDHVRWTDGTPVTAADFLYTYRALARPETQSPYQSWTGPIQELQAPDPYTLVVTLHAPTCTALYSLRHPLLPSAHYAPDFGDLATNPLNMAPAISAGPFQFSSHTPGERIELTRNPDYWQGPVNLDRYVLRIVPDVAEQGRLLETGTVDLARLVTNGTGLQWDTGSAVQVHPQLQPGYTFLAVNLGDPQQPLPGRGSEGDPLAQPPHPILGDRAVRQALALAIDRQGLVTTMGQASGVAGGDAGDILLGGYLLPTIPWANPAPPAPPTHDPEGARALLEQAGWLVDGRGTRIQYGRPLALRLVTNEDNPRRVAMAHAVAADLAQVGVQVRVELLPFDTVAAELLAQRFDLAVAGWDNLASDPGLQPFWHSRDDLPGGGFNFTSLHDPEVDALLDQALTLPGCTPEARGALYAQVQSRVQDALPYLAIVGDWGGWATGPRVANVTPGPWQLHHNVHLWGFRE